MKKIIFLTITLLFVSQKSFAQKKEYDWKRMKPEQRKDLINKMSPQEKMDLLKQFRENMMIAELAIPENTQIEFRTLYSEYQEKQHDIKRKFQKSEDYENMSDEEAKKQLEQSFEIGQQLLDNRKIYSQKFIKVIKPQQVLQMYQTEGKMRNKIIDEKRNEQKSPHKRRP